MKTTPEIPPTDEEIKEIKTYNQGKPNPLVQILSVLFAVSIGPVIIYYLLQGNINSDLLNILILPICFIWVMLLFYVIKNFSSNGFVKILKGVLTPFLEIAETIKTMPKIMWMLALVYLFQWYALFCYWQNSSKAVAKNAFAWQTLNEEDEQIKKGFISFQDSVKQYAKKNNLSFEAIKKADSTYSLLYNNWSAKISAAPSLNAAKLNMIEANDKQYEKAVSATGGINGWYNIVTFLVAFGLVWFAKRISAKYVHFICLILAGAGFIWFSQIHQLQLFYVAITGFGIGWASMMGIPYLMVVNQIPKEKYGVYMGIINMMIVVPMFIQTTTFGFIMKHHLHNDSSKAIQFAGVLLLIAAALTLLIKSSKPAADTQINFSSGH